MAKSSAKIRVHVIDFLNEDLSRVLEQIPIFLSADDNYARYCAVTILSILKNTKTPEKLKFYVLSPDISPSSINYLQKLCVFFNSHIDFITVNLDLFKDFPNFQEHFNLNNYSRLYGVDLCKESEKTVYLDCDTIISGDIINLFSLNLNNHILGAVPHVQLPYQSVFLKTFNLDAIDVYFNSGVLLINSLNWRNNNYTSMILDCCIENREKLHFADQDALNAVFWGNYCHLPGEWNVEARLYKEKLLGLPQTEEITYRMKNAKIIHYTGADKPWNSKNYVPMRHLYRHYSEMLSEEFGWLSVKPEPKICSSLAMIKFIWSCIYFRASYNLKRIFGI